MNVLEITSNVDLRCKMATGGPTSFEDQMDQMDHHANALIDQPVTLSIKVDKLSLLESKQAKIEKMFKVKLQKEFAAATDTTKPPDVQWIRIVGPIGFCKEASAYVCNLCNPVSWFIHEYQPELSHLFDDDTCIRIEQQSSVVLLDSQPGVLCLQGSDELHIIIALSLVEDVIARHLCRELDSSDTAYGSSSIATASSSSIIDDMLKDALTDETGDTEMCDLTLMSDEVKRALLMSIRNEDVTDSSLVCESGGAEAAAGEDLIILPASTLRLDNSNVDDALVRLALDKNYTKDEVAIVLSQPKEEWKESDFLRALHTNRRRLQMNTSSLQASCSGILSPSSSGSLQPQHWQQQSTSSAQNMKKNTLSRQCDEVKDSTAMDVDTDKPYCGSTQGPELLVLDDDDDDDDDDGNKFIFDLRDDVVEEVEEASDNDVIFLKEDRELIDVSSEAEDQFDQGVTTVLNPSGQKIDCRSQGDRQSNTQTKKVTSTKDKTAASHTTTSSDGKRAMVCDTLDPISLIPSSSSSLKSQVSATNVGSQDLPSALLPSMKPVVSKKKRRKLAKLKQEREEHSRSPLRSDRLPEVSQKTNEREQPNACQQIQAVSNGITARNVVPSFVEVPQYNQKDTINQRLISLASVSTPSNLRYIVIDGSNVAMFHGNHKHFSCRGIEIVINHFLQRGHSKTRITAFVPQWRRQCPTAQYPIQDQPLLEKLSREGTVVFTPSRRVGARNINCYDDRFVLDLAVQTEGIVVTNDNYRDLYEEKFTWRSVIEQRLLPYSFVGDFFMLPDDPLGQNGPRLDEFLGMPLRPMAGIRPPMPLSQPIQRPTHAVTGFRGQYVPAGQQRPLQQRPLQQLQQRQIHPQQLWPPPPSQTWLMQLQQNSRLQNYGNAQRPLGCRPPQTNFRPNEGPGSLSSFPPLPHKANAATAAAAAAGGGSKQNVRSRKKTTDLRKRLLEVFPNSANEINEVLKKHQTENIEELCVYLTDQLSAIEVL